MEQPRTYEERQQLAELCTTSLQISLPTVIDKFNNAVELAYAGFLDRIYVLDSDGVVRYKTDPGPFGFKVAEARETLSRVLQEGPVSD